jgi:NHLM bacteriocin system ABC transporter ATP-binding protein
MSDAATPPAIPPGLIGGDLVTVGANHPLLLAAGDVWLIAQGAADVFVVPVASGQPAGHRHHVLRAEAGAALFGVDPAGPPLGLGLLAVGTANTRLERVPPTAITDPARAAEVAALFDRWIVGVSDGLTSQMPPPDQTLVKPGAAATLAADVAFGGGAPVVWVKPTGAAVSFLGDAETVLAPGETWWPLTPKTWIVARGAGTLDAIDTKTALERGVLLPGATAFLGLALQSLALVLRRVEAADRERLTREVESDERVVAHAVEGLAAVLPARRRIEAAAASTGDPLLDVCAIVASAAGIAIRVANRASNGATPKDHLAAIVRASRFRTRPVTLAGSWWTEDNGPLLGWLGDRRPVALIPRSARGYLVIDPTQATRTVVNAAVAATLAPDAVMFYRPLPEQPITIWDLFRFGRRGLGRDAAAIVVLGLLGGLLGALMPIATGIVFDTLIPSADRGRLLQVAVGLIVAALAAGVFGIVRSFALLRLAGKIDGGLEAATWDRLLSLPVPFFRGYSAGDLALRANAVNGIQQTLTGVVLSSMLSVVFSLFNLALMFYYEVRLTIVALLLVVLVLLVTSIANWLQLKRLRENLKIQGLISGLVLQLINGIAKLRVAGAEPRAFAVWAARFAEQKKIGFRARRIAYSVAVFNSAFSVLSLLVIFVTIAFWPNPQFGTGTFLSFNAAFGQFLAAVLAMAGAVTSSVAVVPLYERARPILTTLPEVEGTKTDPGPLKGEIEVQRVSFRYRPDGPLVLHEVDLRVGRGQFVALVGASGAGKSTLYRMLLGFETPSSGSVFYDGRDLASLDLRAVRRQIGVVLQNGKLLWGSIYQNIVGAAPLTLDDAWAAAEAVGLADDIRAMPMGMQTFVAEGAATFSGGQRQRLMLARAIVGKPRIILLDEATSALDNQTQAVVTESLARLDISRVVIAHRLSTILKADRIYVIDAGRVVESGTYDELMAKAGAFAALAKRQIV